MYDLELTKTLIDKASEKCGSKAAVARELGIPQPHVAQWFSGSRKAQPHDVAAIAELAGLDAIKFLAQAQLNELEGSKKGQILARALGKLALATGGALAGVSAHAAPLVDLIRCIFSP